MHSDEGILAAFGVTKHHVGFNARTKEAFTRNTRVL